MHCIFTMVFLCTFVVGGIPTAMAEIYKYTDERGVVHFTDKPMNSKYRPVFAGKTIARDERKYDHIIRMLCREHEIDFALVKAVVKAESAFNPQAISRKGAQGLMQLMPDTARRLEVTDPFNPYDNIQGGVRYLRQMLDTFGGNVTLAVAAYNAGPGAVQSSNAVPPYPETRMYVKRVLQYQRDYLSLR